MSEQPARGTESGGRENFLSRLESRLEQPAEPHAHAAHPAPLPNASVPHIAYVFQTDNLIDEFVLQAKKVGASVYQTDEATLPGQILADLVASHNISTVVFSDHSDLAPVRVLAEGLGLEVLSNVPAESVHADLAITIADAAIAGTGSIVQDSAAAGSRSVSLLCQYHLALVPTVSIVATPADVLRQRKSAADMPPNLVIITGPSRTGDIEQILTIGAHGPLELHLVLIDAGASAESVNT